MQHASHQHLVHLDNGQVEGHIVEQQHFAADGQGRFDAKDLFYQGCQNHRLAVQSQHPVLHFGKVQNGIDQPEHTPGAGAGDLQDFHRLGFQFQPFAPIIQHIQRRQDRGQRVAQIVDDGVHELVTHLFGLLAPGDVLFGGNKVRDLSMLISHRGDGLFLHIQPAVFAQVEGFALPDFPSQDGSPHVFEKFQVVHARIQQAWVFANHLRGVETGDFCESRVDRDDLAVYVGDHDARGSRFQGGALQAQALFGGFAFADVANRRQDQDAIGGLHGAEADLGLELAAILALGENFCAFAHWARIGIIQIILSQPGMPLEALRNQVLYRHTQKFCGGVAKQGRALGVGQYDLAELVHQKDGIRHNVDNAAEALLAQLERGDILQQDHFAVRDAALGAQQVDIELDIAQLPAGVAEFQLAGLVAAHLLQDIGPLRKDFAGGDGLETLHSLAQARNLAFGQAEDFAGGWIEV